MSRIIVGAAPLRGIMGMNRQLLGRISFSECCDRRSNVQGDVAMKIFKTYDAILEFGVFKEKQANRFYLAMAERVADPAIRRIFEELAAEELEHKAKLELELMKIGKVVDTAFKDEGFDSSDYVHSDSPEIDMDFMDVLALAIEKEDAAFRLYVNMVAQAYSQESRDLLLAMAQEEVRHKLRFETERDRLLGRK